MAFGELTSLSINRSTTVWFELMTWVFGLCPTYWMPTLLQSLRLFPRMCRRKFLSVVDLAPGGYLPNANKCFSAQM